MGESTLLYEPVVALIHGKDAESAICVQIFSITAAVHFLAEFFIKY